MNGGVISFGLFFFGIFSFGFCCGVIVALLFRALGVI